MSINLHLPKNITLTPCMTVFGVGGAGCNAVSNMIASGLEGAKFVVANTDAQALEFSKADKKIQLGATITRGLGAGASPEIGRAAAEETIEQIYEHLQGSNLVFITAGMGGGTGTGSAPVIAKAAREQGILTVGVVTKPFHFEGVHRMKLAEKGLAELQNFVDTLLVIPNQNLFRIANERTTFADAFKVADDVLRDAVRSITDLMTKPGLINLDFNDVKTIMSAMGKAMMGTGEAEGENRAIVAAEAAISNPLLDNSSMKGAKGVLINITGGSDMTLFEVDEAANRIREEVDQEANIIFGSAFNSDLEGRIRVSVVATGIDDGTNKDVRQNRIMMERPNMVAPNPRYGMSSNSGTGYVVQDQDYRDIARKNIPDSYIAATKKNDEASLNENELELTDEQEAAFAIPKAVEPKPTNLRTIGIAPTRQDPTPTASKENFTQKTFGLFGKVASSVGLRQSAPPAQASAKTGQSYEDLVESVEEEIEELVTESVVDIPAFQRRNNS